MGENNPVRRVLVAGGLGVVGRAVVEYLDGALGWDVVGIARRPPDIDSPARFISVDLSDRHDCREKLRAETELTHVVFAALAPPAPSPAAEVAANLPLLVNLVEALTAAGAPLVRIVLVQGAKVYGAHLGPYRTPAKESDPRHFPPNFYYNQEDYLRQAAAEGDWTWSAVRPSGVCGVSIGSPMNVALALAVYGSICRELTVPMHFPGTVGGFTHLQELTDARLLARAIAWALTEPRCAGEAFNITNGDLIRWANLWPALAQFFEVEPGPPLPIPLATFMADKNELWAQLTRRDGLREHRLHGLVGFEFTDFLFRLEYDVISDTGKARRFGFPDCLDSESALQDLFDGLRQARIIP